MARLSVQSAVVTIQYVKKTTTRYQGLERFEIGAEKTTGDSLGERLVSFTTLNAWKASLCEEARKGRRPLAVKYRDTGYFDYDLLFVEFAPSLEASA